MTKIAVIGLWHLGSVVSTCFADLGFDVTGVDKDPLTIEHLNKGKAPLFEPDLNSLLKKNIDSGNLFFTTNMDLAVMDADYIFLTYDTRVNEKDEVDLSEVWDACYRLGGCNLKKNVIIIVSSQVPVGTCDEIKVAVKREVAYSPENLRLGKAIACYMKPDRIIIGADNSSTLFEVGGLFGTFFAPIVLMDLRSAEMTKHALNIYLASCISFINEIGNICDLVGADVSDVSRGLLTDSRVSDKAPLHAGLGFSGGHLARDLKILQKLGDKHVYPTYFVNGVLRVNKKQNKTVVKKLEKIFGSMKGLQVGVLGLTYKAGTSTLHRSVSLEIIDDLVKKGAIVKAHDPEAQIFKPPNFKICKNPYQVAKGSDCLLLMTEWQEYKQLRYDLIRNMMNNPVIFDVKNMLDEEILMRKGFKYYAIGRGKF